MHDETLPFSIPLGTDITTAIDLAHSAARSMGRPMSFDFNGVTVTVDETSDRALLLRDWQRAMEGCISGPVGPWPPLKLSAVDVANDKRVREETKRRADKQRADYAAEERRRADELAAKLTDAAPIDAADADAWQTFTAINGDPYGSAVVRFADAWARLMQVQMAEGAALEDVAEQASRDADVEGITGFQYGCAVGALAATWAHGERLRRWHNGSTQIGDEGDRANESGGVLNPAVLVVGGSA